MKILVLALIFLTALTDAHAFFGDFGNWLPETQYETRKEWSEKDLKENLQTSFDSWMACYGAMNGNLPTSSACACPATGEVISIPSNFFGARSCLPQIDQKLLYHIDLSPEQKKTRDNLICECMSNKNSFEFYLSQPQTKDQKKLTKKKLEKSHATEVEVDLARSRLKSRFGLSFGAALTSMNFASTPEETIQFAGVTLPRDQKISKSEVAALKRIIDPASLDDQTCISPREFMFSEQFSLEPDFYADLDQPFVEDDWNYETLSEKMKAFKDMASVTGNQEASRILSRMKFLQRNPIFKAIFMSKDLKSDKTRIDLHRILKRDLPRPICADIFCERTSDFTKKLPNFQRQIRDLLKTGNVNDDIVTGLTQAQKLTWSSSVKPTSEVLPNPLQGTYNDWTTFCEFRNSSQENNANTGSLLKDIEEKEGLDYGAIPQNKEYQQLNKFYCQVPRRDAQNKTMLFGTFRKQSCDGVNRRECLSKFVKTFPFSSDNVGGIMYNINEFLMEPTIVEVPEDASNAIAGIAGNAGLRRASIQALESAPSGLSPMDNFSRQSSGVSSPVARSAVAPSESSTNTTSNSQINGQNFSVISSAAPGGLVNSIIPSGESPKLQELRENRDESQSKVTGLSEELAALRSEMAERQNKNSQDTTAAASLKSRESFLLQQLRKAEADLAESKQRFEERESRERLASTDDEKEDSDDESTGSRRPKRSLAGSTQSGPVAAAVNSDQSSSQIAPSAAPVSSGAQLGPSGSLSSAKGRPGPGSASAPQVSGGVNLDGGDQGSFAITIADTSAAEYAQIREQAVGNKIVDDAPSPEVLNQIINGDSSFLSQYRQRIDALPGKYVLLNVQINGEAREFVVEKDGTKLLLASPTGRFVASIPEAGPVQTRVNELKYLREISNSIGK